MMTSLPQMPVLVEVPFNHDIKPISERLRERLDVQKSIEEVAADSERNTARSEAIREQYLQSVRDRAARETQRGEEAAARKRRAAADEVRKIEQKMEAANERSESRKRELQEKRDADKAKRQQKAEAVLENIQQTHVSTIKKGIEKATRACAAVNNREKRVAEVVKRTGAQVKHALEVAAAMKDKKDSARDLTNDGALDSPHPSVLDSERLASPHPQAQEKLGNSTPRLSVPSYPELTIVPKFDKLSGFKGKENNSKDQQKELIGKSPRRQETPRRPAMMTIDEDKEMLTDHRSMAFERCWFREMNAYGTGYVWCYQIRWDDGSVRTVRGLF